MFCSNRPIQPNKLLQMIIDGLKPDDIFLDLGCGRGQDSLFMAGKGFKITAVDSLIENIEYIQQYLNNNPQLKDNIELLNQDIRDFIIPNNKYRIINAFNSLQFLPKESAFLLMSQIKEKLIDGGYIIIAGLTINDPFYQKPINQNKCFFMPNELKNLFADFKIIFYEEKLIDDIGHIGCPEPHQHFIVRLVAKK